MYLNKSFTVLTIFIMAIIFTVCGVKDAVAAGKISASRYESYLTMLAEVKLLQEKEGRK